MEFDLRVSIPDGLWILVGSTAADGQWAGDRFVLE